MRDRQQTTPRSSGFGDLPASPNRRRIRFACLLVLALAMLAGAVAQAQEWRYRVRPGDTIWDLSRAYLRHDIPWERLQTHNGVDDPWRMTPGIELRMPVAWLRVQPAQATVVALLGEATAHPASEPGRTSPVHADMQLVAGTVLRTATEANLTLGFADGSRLQLHGNSELHLDRLSIYGATGMVDTRLRLIRGRTTNSAKPARGPASRFILDTPGTMATVRGTEFRIGRDHTRTHAEVLEGHVQVSGGGRSLLLDSGQGSVSDSDSRPHPPAALLPAPDLTSWTEDLVRIPATVEWPAIDGAHRYRLQVGPDPEFLVLLQDSLSDTPSAQVAVPGDGVFHARVRAIDAQGLEGHDAVHSFRVAAHPAPPFAIAPAEHATTAGPRPRFRWTSSDGGVRYRLQLARDAAFSGPLLDLEGLRRSELRAPSELEPGDYYWRIGATDANGGHGPYGDPIQFTLGEAQAGPEIGEDGLVRQRRDLQVRWPSGDGEQGYRFQLARDAAFTDIELDTELGENHITLPKLRSGTWYMRTQLVDSDGYAHPFGPTQSVRIGCLPCRIALGAAALLLVL